MEKKTVRKYYISIYINKWKCKRPRFSDRVVENNMEKKRNRWTRARDYKLWQTRWFADEGKVHNTDYNYNTCTEWSAEHVHLHFSFST